jgi:hypothetical protein
MDTKGSLDVLGRTAIDGSVCPRELPEVLSSCDVWELVELVDEPELTCRALTPAWLDDDEVTLVDFVAEVKAVTELEEKLRVVVEAEIASGTELGISTGQKDHTFRP